MSYGLISEEYNFLLNLLINPLKQFGAQLFIFGSRATGKYQKFSDIDILYIPNIKSPITGHFIFNLISEMEESRFPYKVDLVNYNELASSYKVQVDKEKI